VSDDGHVVDDDARVGLKAQLELRVWVEPEGSGELKAEAELRVLVE